MLSELTKFKTELNRAVIQLFSRLDSLQRSMNQISQEVNKLTEAVNTIASSIQSMNCCHTTASYYIPSSLRKED